jgi:hypothetical protein
LRPAASDLTTGGATLELSSANLQLYADTGAFQSRVFDAGDARAVWGKLTPAVTGTDVKFETRSGNTAVPDSSWSAYQAVAADGSIASPSGRYIQYRATLSTTDDRVTPSLTRVELGYDIDTAAPTTALDVQVSGTTATATFSSPDADLARFECSQDGGAYATCTSPRAFTGLTPGSHTISVRAVDKVGNVGAAASRTVTVAGSGGTTPPPSGGGNTPDRTKPNVLVLGRSLKVSSSGVAKMRIRCPRSETRCAVTVKLKKGGKRIARKSLTIPGGSTRTVRLKLSSAARAALDAKGKIKASAVITATDAAGNTKTTTRRVTLKAPAV